MHLDGPYCLLHQRGTTTLVRGSLQRFSELAQMPRPSAPGELVISMLPYSQIKERGFMVHDGGEPLLCLTAHSTQKLELDDVLDAKSEAQISISPPSYNLSDAEFARRVAAIIESEIQNGEGSNFLFSRKSHFRINGFGQDAAHTLFRRLARNEFGAYLTFCFFDGTRYFIGSSPERHISIESGQVRMNPICGTLPKRALKTKADLAAFLSDPKEVNELFQVVDEELKMMAKICREGGEVLGPYLKEMSSVLHTEYVLEGRSSLDVIEALRLSMFAATMIGSPLENAARIIHKYETESRRYYSSAITLLSADDHGQLDLDSAITIRTIEVDAQGQAVLQTGASIVRDSVPEAECREVSAKAEGMMRALQSGDVGTPILGKYKDAEIDALFTSRNERLSRFWSQKQPAKAVVDPSLRDVHVLIIDNEDEFTFMLKHAFEHLGARALVVNYDDPKLTFDDADVVLVGPGPGDPQNARDPKMATLHALVDRLLAERKKTLGVCLGHQILCHRLGLPIVKTDPPLQGVQKTIDLFGKREPCGYYNTFFGVRSPKLPADVEVAAEADGKINALRAPNFVSFQFHVESVLTKNGVDILGDALRWLGVSKGA